MHLPDGFFSNSVSAGLIGAAFLAIAHAVKQVFSKIFCKKTVMKKKLAFADGDSESNTIEKWFLTKKGRDILFKGFLVATIVFFFQAFDFSIGFGSGHLIGSALAAIVIGPYFGILLMSGLLFIQAFFFADGGMLALGINIINMAVIGCLSAHLIYNNVFNKPTKGWHFFKGVFLATLFSVLAMAFFYAGELYYLGEHFEIATSVLMSHLIIGAIEGLATYTLIRFLFTKHVKN